MMSLYLCVFDFSDNFENEIMGVEVGSYSYFGVFRDCICKYVENNQRGSRCPYIMNHEDSNGVFTPNDCSNVLHELSLIKGVFTNIPLDNDIIANMPNLLQNKKPCKTLADCFVDIDGCNLIEQLTLICKCSIETNLNLYFQ